MTKGFKTTNLYQEMFPNYTKTPKAVIAAVAIALAIQITGNDSLFEGKRIITNEWRILHEAGIVPQKPPKNNNDPFYD